jgi:Family of unknown function (DUF6353)
MLSSLAVHANKVKYLLNENSPTILTAVGVGGTVVTAVLTGRASFKAAEIIEQKKRELEAELKFPEVAVEISKTDKTKMVWREFLPPVATGLVTITSIIAANKISSTKIAALTVAAGVSERALTEYKEKALEKLGVRQEQKIRDEVAQDRVTKYPAKGEVLLIGDGQVLCYDMLTGRYFKSSMEDIKRAENKVNFELIHFMSCSLSHFYDEIGLQPTSYSDMVGWNTGNSPVEVKFSTVFSEDNRPCIAIDFTKPPIADYDKHWD